MSEYQYILHDYSWSDDHEKLFELMQQKDVICFCRGNQVVLSTGFSNIEKNEFSYEISDGEFDYVTASSKADFIKQCKKEKIWFLPPNNV